jgi:hypothetical protein
MALSVVPDAEPHEIEQRIIAKARNGARPVDLEREFGKSRQQIRRILKNAKIKRPVIKDDRPRDRPPAPPKQETPKPAPKPIVQPTSAWGYLSNLIGAILLGIGLWLNCQYWYAMGGNLPAFGVIGFLIDSITAAGPTLASELWRRNRGFIGAALVALALIVWAPIMAVSLVASAGYTNKHIGDTVAERRGAMRDAKALEAVIARKEAERKAVDGTDLPDVLEVEIQKERATIRQYFRSNWQSSNECRDTTWSGPVCKRLQDLWTAKKNAEARIRLDEELKPLYAQRSAAPTIESADPASERASKMIGGSLKPEAILDYVLNVVAALPALSGLFFLIGARLR